MYIEPMIFCLEVKGKFPFWPHPSPFHMATVLDIGSLDINGNNRYLFTECGYTGVDTVPGPNVNVVSSFMHFAKQMPEKSFDTIICTEMLEHDREWQESLFHMKQLLKPGGLLIITCATGNRPEHWILDRKPVTANKYKASLTLDDLPQWYQNRSRSDIEAGLDVYNTFSRHEFKIRDNVDLYFWGVKKV